MLPRARRIRRAKDFSHAWRSRKVARHPALTVRFIEGESTIGRAGFVVGKTVSKRAVVRNTIKRRLRAMVATMNPPLRSDIVIIAQPPAVKLTYHELHDILLRLLASPSTRPARPRHHFGLPKNPVARP